MLINYLKLAWRNLVKDKTTSLINFFGLVVGMTAALLIWQYVAFEKSFDTFHENGENIYRVRTDRFKDGEVILQFAGGAAVAANVLTENFPEVEKYVKIYEESDQVMQYKDKKFQEEKIALVTPTYFDIFSFPLLKGDPTTCLDSPYKICISESKAKQYFGTEEAIGKTIRKNDEFDFVVTGIFADPPINSHMKFDMLLSYATFTEVWVDSTWAEISYNWDGFKAYLELKPDTDVAALQSKIDPFISKKYQESDNRNKGFDIRFVLEPMLGIHLNSNLLGEAESNSDGKTINFIMLIGGLVLFIAWFNYINLATARSDTRAREVGVRKVLGCQRSDLIKQFMMESAILNGTAIITAFILAQFLSPFFAELIEQPMRFVLFNNPKVWASIIFVFLAGTVLSGIYPAFVLSSFEPLAAINSSKNVLNRFSGKNLRKGLVILQFATSVLLIAGTMTIYQQLKYMQEKNLGVDIKQTLVLKAPTVADSLHHSKYRFFKNSITQLSTVDAISRSTSIPGKKIEWTAGGIRRWGESMNKGVGLFAMATDFNFTQMFDLKLLEGRHMDAKLRQDSSALLINKKAMELLDFKSPKEALGVEINFWDAKYTIVGVLDNFHQESPKIDYEPIIIRPYNAEGRGKYYNIKVNTADINQTLTSIESTWNKTFTNDPFNYFFLDDRFNAQFKSDQRLGLLLSLFSALAIFVSCLGLLALATFVARRRTKEIGIRKVLGASVENIVTLLSKEFLVLISIGIILIIPIGYWLLDSWLNNYANRIEVPLWIFFVAGMAALTIALCTISIQSVKAALRNPVASLRDE